MEKHYDVVGLVRGNSEQRMKAIFAAVGYRSNDDFAVARRAYVGAKEVARKAELAKKMQEEEATREERARIMASKKNFRFKGGRIMNGAELVDHLLACGYTALASKRVGTVVQYSLRNPESDNSVRVRKVDGTMDYAVLLLEKLEMADAKKEATANSD